MTSLTISIPILMKACDKVYRKVMRFVGIIDEALDAVDDYLDGFDDDTVDDYL